MRKAGAVTPIKVLVSDISFQCTECGNCCKDLRLPVTPAEARTWLERGGRVDVLCEALPWPAEPEPDNVFAEYKRRRSFAADSGTLPVRIDVTLAASFSGPCPNLGDDLRCRAYDTRPLVCRVYPAEINPFIELRPENKGCPPEAWRPGTAPLLAGGTIVDATTREAAERSRVEQERAVPAKQAICAALGIDRASVANEGFLILSPEPADLLAALCALPQAPEALEPAPGEGAAPRGWTLVSNRQQTIDVLGQVGALSELDRAPQGEHAYLYIGMHAAS
ncbi:YkgJ family cysteine cluster protein [Burkholderia plantarii]|uniref:YkgJ family cysteine cluster protein n=1 Tax=Burkholderia plantarii TaxID=41899 RepID=UPI0025B74C38|nr:YkgJ family cysteine cluster protein [Burkholderia plantarii]